MDFYQDLLIGMARGMAEQIKRESLNSSDEAQTIPMQENNGVWEMQRAEIVKEA